MLRDLIQHTKFTSTRPAASHPAAPGRLGTPPGPPGPCGATGTSGEPGASYVYGYYIPRDFPEATNNLGAPTDWDSEANGECLSLPVQKLLGGGYLSKWKIGNREIEVIVYSNSHPAISIKSIN